MTCPLNTSGECPGIPGALEPTDDVLAALESFSSLDERLAFLETIDPSVPVPLAALDLLGIEVAQ